MRVTKVTAYLRYAAEAKGAWRAIEVGAEASLTSNAEDWEAAQADLYHHLGQQLNRFWSNGTAKADPPGAPAEVTPPERSHWCIEHQAEFKAKNGPHGEFYSHRINGTNGWCNEKASTS